MLIIKRLAIFLFIFILSSCSSTKSKTNIVPSTLDEAIIQLKASLSQEDLNHIRNGSEDDLALWRDCETGLRNSWGLWTGSPLSRWFNQKGIYHPDDMSRIITVSLYRDLHDIPRKLDKQIEYYQAYWEEVENNEKKEAELDLIRSERRKTAMLGWTWVSNYAPEAILPRKPNFYEIWGLEPYNGGFLIIVKNWRKNFNPVWHDGIYFLSSPTGNLEPVKLNSCPEIYDVVVVDEVANWLCKESNGDWSILSTTGKSKSIKRYLDNIPDQKWMRLGKGETGFLIITSDTIYREDSGRLNKIFTASSPTREYPKFDHDKDSRRETEYFFPHRSGMPLEHQEAIYFQVEDTGNETDLYRLSLNDTDLEGFGEIFVYDYVGNWLIRTSDIAVGNESELWIGSPHGGTLVKLDKNGDIKIASLFNRLSPIDSIDAQGKNLDWKTCLPSAAIYFKDKTMYLAGTNGIAKVDQGKITPIVYFTYPNGIDRIPYTSRPQFDYHIKPQRLGMFVDGSFIIGDRFDGVYIVHKIDKNYEFYLPSIVSNSYFIN